MDLLSKLESTLEGLVEGVFSRAFRAPLQPIEVAKRITREMETHRTVSVNATYVPNVYTVYLAPRAFATFSAVRDRLLTELEQYLRDFANEQRYQSVGVMAVLLAEDDTLKSSETRIDVASDAHALPSGQPPPPPVAQLPNSQMQAVLASAPAVALEVMNGAEKGRRISLSEGLTLGRGATNAVSLSSRGVSRRHADIVQQGNHWVLRDLGSTNGIYVNQKKITTHILRPGDLIAIGDAILQAH